MTLGDFQLKVTSPMFMFDETSVTGITISYGVNSIPVAQVDLDAAGLMADNPNFLCNPDSYKTRNNITTIELSCTDPYVCLTFTGFFDGLSEVQNVGGISYTANFKNQFDRFTGIFPRCPGIIPTGFMPFASVDSQQVFNDPNSIYGPTQIADQSSMTAKTDVTVAQYLLQRIQLILEAQNNYPLIKTQFKLGQQLYGLIQDIYKLNNKLALSDLFPNISTEFVNKCQIYTNQCAEGIAKDTLYDHESIWEMLVKCFGEMGCCLVVANEELWILPQAQYVKMTHAVPLFQQITSAPNTVNPGQYNNWSCNDTGFANIKACYIVPVCDGAGYNYSLATQPIIGMMGAYPLPATGTGEDTDLEVDNDPELPDDGSTGILLLNTSPYFLRGADGFNVANGSMQGGMPNQKPPFTVPALDPITQVKNVVQNVVKLITKVVENTQTLLNQYAKLKFLQAKYADRHGSFTCLYDPRWVPGRTGSLYMRLPGTFKQFYVTNVVHQIAMRVPNNGNATTTVYFSSARQGNPPPGVKQDDLFTFGETEMNAFQAAFYADITR